MRDDAEEAGERGLDEPELLRPGDDVREPLGVLLVLRRVAVVGVREDVDVRDDHL
jgi:hypothetical protein